MNEIKNLIYSLAPVMTVAGYENFDSVSLDDILGKHFDEMYTDNVGNRICIKRCGSDNAPKLMLDAHLDEIGMLVSEICDGGFLRVVSVGGIDTRIMAASEVWIYGERTILGVIVSTPPHLQNSSDSKKLKAVNDLLIDTGYSKDELEKIVNIGTPIGFKTEIIELLNNRIAGKGFDDKSCAACIIRAVDMLAGRSIGWDIYATFTVREEVGSLGARAATYAIMPDAAIVLDVNFAIQPNVPRSRAGKMGSGPMLSLSAVTDRALTDAIVDFAEGHSLKYQVTVEAMSTGTNANTVNIVGKGIPTAVMSLPLKNMHTYSEVISLDDAEDTAKLLSDFIYAGGIDKWYRN